MLTPLTDELLEKAARKFCEKTGDDAEAKIPATNDPQGPWAPRWKMIAASIQFHDLIRQCIADVTPEEVPIEPSESLAAAIDKLK